MVGGAMLSPVQKRKASVSCHDGQPSLEALRGGGGGTGVGCFAVTPCMHQHHSLFLSAPPTPVGPTGHCCLHLFPNLLLLSTSGSFQGHSLGVFSLEG